MENKSNLTMKINKGRRKRVARKVFGLTKGLIKLGLLAFIVIATMVAVAGIMDDMAIISTQQAVIDNHIELAQARQREIADAAQYTTSTAFVEYIARTRLGLARRDEIIFIMTDGNNP